MDDRLKSVEDGFRRAMRAFASTVTIVTGGEHGRCHGMTATAVSSLSMAPPSLLVCINRSSLLNDIMVRSPHFCVNVLTEAQADLSAAFSGKLPPEERFGLGAWLRTPEGLPYLQTASANIFCRKTAAMPYASHTILIGEVEDVAVNDGAAPLVYHDGRYCSASQAPLP